MKLVKYSRRQPIYNVSDDMNRLFNRLWLRPTVGRDLYDRDWTPAFNILETADQFKFDASLPGLTKKDIEITLSEGQLSVSGERSAVEAQKGETIHSSELLSGTFHRSITLPGEVDENSVEARFKDGILSITVKKLEPVEPERRKISIK